MEAAVLVLSSLTHKQMEMGVEIKFLSERLDDDHHPGPKLSAGCGLEIFVSARKSD